MKIQDILDEVMLNIDDMTTDLKTKQYKQFLELLKDEIDNRLESLDEYETDNEDEDYEDKDYEDYDE